MVSDDSDCLVVDYLVVRVKLLGLRWLVIIMECLVVRVKVVSDDHGLFSC